MIVYLHGAGEDPLRSLFRSELEKQGAVWAPMWEPPSWSLDEWPRLDDFMRDLLAGIGRGPVVLVGYSFGGLLAAGFAAQHPGLISKLVLLAPAIDNIERNYSGGRRAPGHFLSQLRKLGSRPDITKVPSVIVHGGLDSDRFGGALWRITEYATQTGAELVLLPRDDHSLTSPLPWEELLASQ